jgi:hypothetical protein
VSVTDDERRAAADVGTPARWLGVLAHRDVELARLVAKNPSVSSGLLARLARLTDEQVRARVIAHPSTPWRVVLALAERAPERFAATPRGRAAFEASHAVRGLMPRARTVRALLASRALRERWESELSEHPFPSVRRALVEAYEHDRDAPRRAMVLAGRLEDTDARVRATAIRAHEILALEAAARLSRDPDLSVRHALATHASTPVVVLCLPARDPSALVRGGAAGQSRLPPEVVEALTHDAAGTVRAIAATNAALPEARALALSDDPDRSVREALVRNPSTPAPALVELVRQLAYDDYDVYFVMPRLLGHPNGGEDVAAAFAEVHGARGLRDALSFGGRVPRVWIARAARSTDVGLRAAAARHEPASRELLEALARDRSPVVRAAVASRHVSRTRRAASWRGTRSPGCGARSRAVERRPPRSSRCSPRTVSPRCARRPPCTRARPRR